MRAFQGQMSDTKPIQRNAQERAKLLRELEATLAAMKPHVSADLRRSVQSRIAELRVQVRHDGEAAVQRSAPGAATAPAANGRRREVSPEEEARRARRSPRAAHAF